MINISTRLQSLVDILQYSEVTVDVGCDHGFVTLYVLKNNIAKHVVATDISDKCLDKTRALISQHSLDNRATFVATDGLCDIHTAGIDQIIIAGMGGSTIMHIIEHMPKSCKSARLILQPMNNIMNLRVFLAKSGYTFERDMIVQDDGRFYHIMSLVPGKCTLDELAIHCGAVVSDYTTTDYQAWLKHTIHKMQDIVDSMPTANPRRLKFMRGIYNLNSILKGD